MFAVKGWSVDPSALKAQEAPAVDSPAGSKEAARKDRKRKRGIGGPDKTQPKEDVGSLWAQHIEGKDPGKVAGAPKERKEKKGGKVQSEGKNGQAPVTDLREKEKRKARVGEETNGEGASGTKAEKAVKKRRKERGSADGEGQKQRGTANGVEVQKSETALDAQQQSSTIAAKAPPPVPPLPAAAKLTPMQAAMRQKLVSARFRHLNQTLYTTPSATALQLFDQNPEMFEDYHAGFRQQVDVWPENPLDNFIATIRSRGAVKQPSLKDKNKKAKQPLTPDAAAPQPLPRTHGTAILADLGCGDARLAQTLHSDHSTTRLKLQIHSFDLHSPSPLVTKADIAQLPLPDASADIAIFCLALMGTNWISFIEEAYRILHWKGELWVAEIKSRFGRVTNGRGKPVEHSVGGKRKQKQAAVLQQKAQAKEAEVDEQAVLRSAVDGVEPATQREETDVAAFVAVLKRRGFVLKDGEKGVDLGNKMFVKMEFVKGAVPMKGKGVVAVRAEQRVGAGNNKKRFVEEEKEGEEVGTEDEAKVLKPCLYKVR